MATKRGKFLGFLSGKTIFSVFLLLLLSASLCWGAAPSVEVHLERNRTTPDRPVTLVLRITGTREAPEVIPGKSSHLRLISRGQSSSVQIINGSRSEHLDLYYAVVPEKTGTLEIPSLELRFPSGARLQTEPLSLEVTERSSSSSAPSPKGEKPGGDTPGGPSRKAFVTASLSREQVYAGEPVIYRFSFFRSLPVGESQLSPPDFGTLPWEVLEREVYRTEIEGTPYVVTEIPFLLFPVMPGEASISSAALDVMLQEEGTSQSPFSGAFPGDALFPSSLEDFFNFSPFSGRPYHLESQPLSLDVLPLPAWQGNPPFSGLVGSADMRCLLEPREAQTGDSLQLTVLVRGKGNMRDLEAPELLLPEGIKAYENPPEESLRRGAEGYEGIRAFSWSLIPLRPGSWNLPPVQLVLFDPRAEKYEVLKASIPSFSAKGAVLSEEPPTAAPSATPSPPQIRESSSPVSVPESLRLREEIAPNFEEMLPPLTPEWRAVLFAVPPVFLGLLLLLREIRRRKNTVRRNLLRQSRKALAEAKRERDLSKKLLLLRKALTRGVFAKIGRRGELLTRDLLFRLENKELSSEEVREILSLLAALEAGLYGNRDIPGEINALEKEMTRLIRRLWK